MDTGELLRWSEQLAELSRDAIQRAEEMSRRFAEVVAQSDATVKSADETFRAGEAHLREGLPAKPKHS